MVAAQSRLTPSRSVTQAANAHRSASDTISAVIFDRTLALRKRIEPTPEESRVVNLPVKTESNEQSQAF